MNIFIYLFWQHLFQLIYETSNSEFKILPVLLSKSYINSSIQYVCIYIIILMMMLLPFKSGQHGPHIINFSRDSLDLECY